MASAIVLATAAIPAVAISQNAQGPLSEGVAAVVNDDVISTYDVLQRMRLLMVTSGVQPTQENLPQLQAEALRSLVDERLQMQELRRVEKVAEVHHHRHRRRADPGDQRHRAQQQHHRPEQLLDSLAAQGVGADTFKLAAARPGFLAELDQRPLRQPPAHRRGPGEGLRAPLQRAAVQAAVPGQRGLYRRRAGRRHGDCHQWRRPAGRPTAAGRAVRGRGPPVLGLAHRGQRRRRRLDRGQGVMPPRSTPPSSSCAPASSPPRSRSRTASTSSCCATSARARPPCPGQPQAGRRRPAAGRAPPAEVDAARAKLDDPARRRSPAATTLEAAGRQGVEAC
jgi:hypothetical protein